jgi:outer membrane protein TolC
MRFSRFIRPMTAITHHSGKLLCLAGLFLFMNCVNFVQAQNNNSAPVRPKNPQTVTATSREGDPAFEEKLVELALNGPRMIAGIHQNKINEYQLKAARNQWINILSLSLNYNDQSFNKYASNGTYIFPRYYIGLTIPLGTLLSRTQVRAAQEAIEVSKANQEELRRTIRAEVLTKYRQYRAYNDLITAQSMMVNDVQTNLAQTEDRFRKGAATLEQYNTAQRNRNDEIAKLINLQMERDLIKIDLERMIGTNLESVTR